MSARPGLRPRAGVTLVELIVALVISGIIGTALVGMLSGQSRFFQQQSSIREARQVSRAALNVIGAELRMVETAAGLVEASTTSVTLRVPYAFGVVCSAVSVVSLLPSDSVMFATAVPSGYAWRQTDGSYAYVQPAGNSIVPLTSCDSGTAESITPLAGGRAVSLDPLLPLGTPNGTPVFLYQTIRYELTNRDAVPGTVQLWRIQDPYGSAHAERIAAPFDSATTGFRFYVAGSDTAQAAPPATLASVRGLQLQLNGRSAHVLVGDTAANSVPVRTAIFFRN